MREIEIIDKPKEYECDSRGTRDRLENLINTAPDRWTVHAEIDSTSIVQQLKSAIERLETELESIDGVQAYRRHRWFDRFRPTQENAAIFYTHGDLEGAWDEVLQLCEMFADRKKLSEPKWWIEELRLSKLIARCSK